MCKFFTSGHCALGKQCRYAHSVEELRSQSIRQLPPEQLKRKKRGGRKKKGGAGGAEDVGAGGSMDSGRVRGGAGGGTMDSMDSEDDDFSGFEVDGTGRSFGAMGGGGTSGSQNSLEEDSLTCEEVLPSRKGSGSQGGHRGRGGRNRAESKEAVGRDFLSRRYVCVGSYLLKEKFVFCPQKLSEVRGPHLTVVANNPYRDDEYVRTTSELPGNKTVAEHGLWRTDGGRRQRIVAESLSSPIATSTFLSQTANLYPPHFSSRKNSSASQGSVASRASQQRSAAGRDLIRGLVGGGGQHQQHGQHQLSTAPSSSRSRGMHASSQGAGGYNNNNNSQRATNNPPNGGAQAQAHHKSSAGHSRYLQHQSLSYNSQGSSSVASSSQHRRGHAEQGAGPIIPTQSHWNTNSSSSGIAPSSDHRGRLLTTGAPEFYPQDHKGHVGIQVNANNSYLVGGGPLVGGGVGVDGGGQQSGVGRLVCATPSAGASGVSLGHIQLASGVVVDANLLHAAMAAGTPNLLLCADQQVKNFELLCADFFKRNIRLP